MDNSTRLNIIAAAVTAAGPQGDDLASWQAKVQENAVELVVMASESSNIAKALDAVESAKVFTGTVVSVKRENSSTRGVVTLFTGTDQDRDGVPPGHEQIRTDRTDNPAGLAMARKMRDLIGHRVLVRVNVEEFNGGRGKVRVLVHVTDLGVDQQYVEQSA